MPNEDAKATALRNWPPDRNFWPGEMPTDSSVARTQNFTILMTVIAAYGLVAAIFLLLRDYPTIAFLLGDLVLCLTLASLCQPFRFRGLFLLHPVLLFIFSLFFGIPFTELGDGPAYKLVLDVYFETETGTIFWDSWIFQNDILTIFKNAGFGVLPVYFIPDYIFSTQSPESYYLWQGTWHIGLLLFAVTLARLWNAIDLTYLAPITLFAAIGPSFFDLGSVPTRHIVTFSSVLLYLICYLALRKSVTIPRIAAMSFAVLLILVSKAPLMLPALLFVLVDLILIDRTISRWRILLIIAAVTIGFAYLGNFFVEKVQSYAGGIAREEVGSLGYLASYPIIGPVAKLLFALLAPFPWSKALYFIETNYGENWPLFLAHIGSSLFGVYFFIVLALRWRAILDHPDIQLRQMVIFGVIMSSSIMGGATSFHSYILIYFPFFMPLLMHRNLAVHPFLPIGAIGLLEIIAITAA